MESPPWSAHPDVPRLAHGAVAPALVEIDSEPRMFACGTRAICEYLEETSSGRGLLPSDPAARAEVRRLWAWIEAACEEVTDTLLTERVMQWVRRDRHPDSARLRRGAHALRGRLTFLNGLLELNGYLACRVCPDQVASELQALAGRPVAGGAARSALYRFGFLDLA